MVARARLGVLALVLVACSLALAAAPGSVLAGEYEVQPCSESSSDGFVIDPPGQNIAALKTNVLCAQLNPILQQVGAGSGFTDQRDETSWSLVVPNGVHIASLSAKLAVAGLWDTSTTWTLKDGNGGVLDSFAGPARMDSNPLHPSGPVEYLPTGLGGSSITSTLRCPVTTSPFCALSTFVISFTDLRVVLRDDFVPAVTALGGSVVNPGTVTGQRSATFSAADGGSGVAKVAVLVDGRELESFVDENGGLCRVPYKVLVPCAHDENPDFEFLSEHLPDGTHQVQAEAIDASGNVAKSAPVAIVTHNAPTNTVPPAITGTPKLGATLTATSGTWSSPPPLGPPSRFSYQWLRCPASVTTAAGAGGCQAIKDATHEQYTLTSADIYGRAIVRVTASNGSVTTTDASSAPTAPIADANGRTTPPPGSGGAGGGGTGGGGAGGGPTGVLDTTPPVLSAVSLTRTRFGVARSRTAIAALVRGTRLRLTSGEGGRLSIAVVRVRPGQRARTGGKFVCRAVRRSVRRGRCTALATVATLTRMVGAGRSSVAFSGRIGSRALAPGSYRLVLTVRDGAGNVSKAVQRSFTIVRG
jgi:hypothetical protein